MDRQRWKRAGGVAGVLAVLLALAGFVVPGLAGTPAHSASVPMFAATLVAHERAIALGGWLLALAGLSLLCFTWSLGSTLRSAEGEPSGLSDVIFAAGALWAFLWVIAGQLLQAAVGLADYYQHPHGAKTAVVLSNLPVNESGPLLPALVVGSTALVSRRTQVFPYWYARFSIVLAPLLLLGSGLSAVGLAFPILPFSMALLLFWLVITSLLLMQTRKVRPQR